MEIARRPHAMGEHVSGTQTDTGPASLREDAPVVSVVIPCLNEVETIGRVVDAALVAFAAAGVTGEVVVADNGSTDGSQELATAHGARVVREPVKGYGSDHRRDVGLPGADGGECLFEDRPLRRARCIAQHRLVTGDRNVPAATHHLTKKPKVRQR